MPLHHYLPATFLASFSTDSSTSPRRNRHLYVGNKQSGHVFRTRAAKVGAENNLYTLVAAADDPEMVDKVWSGYEGKLHEAIELLIAGKVDAKTWVRVLVPFVSCMFVRGPDFDERFGRRMSALGADTEPELLSEDNTNHARLIELQRLLGPIAVAKWIVIRMKGQKPLITNDLGYAPFSNTGTMEAGIAIPLNPSHVLAVIPREQGRIAVVRSGRWVPDIEYVDNALDNQEGLNRALSSMTRRFIFGPDKETVSEELQEPGSSSVLLEPGDLGFIAPRRARAYELTWHRLAVALKRDPSDIDSWDFPLDWKELAEDWAPPAFFSGNLVEFPPALYREGQAIHAEFYDPEPYYSLSRIWELQKLGEHEPLLEEATRGLASTDAPALKARFLVARGGSLDELGRYEAALRDYGEALRFDSESTAALVNRSATLLKLGKLDAASQDLEKALSINPDDGLARVNRGSIYNLRKQPAAAIREITRALQSLPEGPEQGPAYLSRGNANLTLGNHRESVEDFSKAAQHFLDSEPKAFCEFRKAVALAESGDFDGARRAIAASLELNDESSEVHLFKNSLSFKNDNTEGGTSQELTP